MSKNCSWCGKKIGFFDLTYTIEMVGDDGHLICSECSGKVFAAKNGTINFEEIKTERTAPELYAKLADQATLSEEIIQAREVRQKQEKIKDDARQTNPLYDDLHQIAEDLRFIKNYLIFCIVVGIIFGFIWLITVL